jgi:CubicO group peptidase (beta-lactamase class C family)
MTDIHMDAAAVTGRHADVRRRLATLDDGRQIQGFVDDGFGGMVDAFVANFVDRNDTGAACCVIVDGRVVVDLWGGVADARTGRAWSHDTAAVIFSCTKGVLALLAYRLVDGGRLDLDAPIARYWPEFAQADKAAITVRQAMSHRSGLAALDADLTAADVIAWTPVIRAIERQRPAHDAAAGHAYHPMTYGWIVGEVIRRVTGATPGAWLQATVADALGLHLGIGTPEAARATVAWMEPPLPDEDSDAARETARIAAADPAFDRGATLGGAYAFPSEGGYVTFNDPGLQAAELPGANGIASAHSLARLYSACVSDRWAPRLLSTRSIDDALRVQAAGRPLNGMPDDGARWGTGFQLASPPTQPMLGPTSFGHAGAGGQLAFADREAGLGFAWLGNQMGGFGDARARSLTEALRRIVAR